MATRIQKRRDTAANWTAVNPVLAQGEEGLELDTNKEKIGNGTTAWNSLPYKTLGVTPSAIGAATAAQGAKADSAVQPAGLTKAAVSLGNVDNTSDVNKPVSTAQAAALAAHVAAADPHPGYLTAAEGNAAYATSAQGAKADSAVQPAGLTKAAVGLGNVDNTSDVNKPVSTAQAAALAVKADTTAVVAAVAAHEAAADPHPGYLTAAEGNAAYATAAQGTKADTAIQPGNPALSDSREWSADTISQAEAETGTATTRRAFSALRVFQSIASWWNGSAAKTKLDGIQDGAQANVSTNLSYDAATRNLASSTGSPAVLPLFGSGAAGLVPAGGSGTTKYLREDGAFAEPPGAGGSPGGSNTQIQFNDGGTFGGDVDLTYDKTTNLLTSKGDILLDDGGSFTTTLQTVTATANRTISFPDATGTVALVGGSSGQVLVNTNGAVAGLSTLTADSSGNLTLSARLTNSYNAAANAPAKLFSGTWFTGGTSTTTKPHVLIEPAGTTSNNFNTAGTGFAVNGPAGFLGDLAWFGVNGTSRLKFNATNNELAFQSDAASSIRFRSFSLVAGLYNRTILACNENGALSWPHGIGEIGAATLLGANAVGYTPEIITFRSLGAVHADVRLTATANGTLQLDNRSGGAGTFYIVNTFTSDTNFERARLRWASNVFLFGTEKGTAGGTARAIEFQTDGITRVQISRDGFYRYSQPAPAAVNSTATLTVANLQAGIITTTTAAAVDLTLPTGTNVEGGFAVNSNGLTMQWSVINTGSNSATVLAATDHTLVGSGVVAAGSSGRFATRRTAANTYVTYRLGS